MTEWLKKILEKQNSSCLSMEQANEIMKEIDCEHKQANLYVESEDLEDDKEIESEDMDEPEEEREAQDKDKKEEVEELDFPRIIGAKAVEEGVRIWWIPVKNSDGYYIYRKTPKKDWKLVKKTRKQKGTFLDKKVRPNKRYQYTIEAFRDVGETRVFSKKEPYVIQIRSLQQEKLD